MRDDVWITYGRKGCLTVGGYAAKGCIGPELGFGWEVGNFLDNQVLLIKFGVGGTSLAQNWRPPSSGGTVGEQYRNLISGVKEQLADLKRDFPDYDDKGYEIVGFGWHQGWQDGCAQNMAEEYEKNMANFIRDVRKDLGVPKLPFVIGGSGFGGWEQTNGRRLKIMAAQSAVADPVDFKDSVRYVETRGFYRAEDVSPHKFRYHWNGNAETYYLIGEGMGKAMVELLGGPKAPPNPTGPPVGR
ncbi:MAG: sialate O-acetylesterase [Planctomycetota bacterium]|nr:sialate O-acetylesterase [Planctomycetota bacterium]